MNNFISKYKYSIIFIMAIIICVVLMFFLYKKVESERKIIRENHSLNKTYKELKEKDSVSELKYNNQKIRKNSLQSKLNIKYERVLYLHNKKIRLRKELDRQQKRNEIILDTLLAYGRAVFEIDLEKKYKNEIINPFSDNKRVIHVDTITTVIDYTDEIKEKLEKLDNDIKIQSKKLSDIKKTFKNLSYSFDKTSLKADELHELHVTLNYSCLFEDTEVLIVLIDNNEAKHPLNGKGNRRHIQTVTLPSNGGANTIQKVIIKPDEALKPIAYRLDFYYANNRQPLKTVNDLTLNLK